MNITFVRTLTFGILFSVNCLFAFGQTKTTTKELERIANTFGADSALKTVQPFIDIYKIDTAVALSIALNCSTLHNYTRQFSHFTEVGQLMRSEELNSKALENLKSYKAVFSDTSNSKHKNFIVPDQIFHVLLFQNFSSIIPELRKEFDFWESSADSIQKKYPSAIKRFFQWFNGVPPSVQLYCDCKANCFKLAWTLHKFGVAEFTVERVNALRKQLVPYERDYNMDRFKFKSYEVDIDTIELKNSYASLDEIAFDSEPEFVKLKGNLEGEKCWKNIVTNDKYGLYEVGCQWAELAGRGWTLRLVLIAPNKLRTSIVSSWIS